MERKYGRTSCYSHSHVACLRLRSALRTAAKSLPFLRFAHNPPCFLSLAHANLSNLQLTHPR